MAFTRACFALNMCVTTPISYLYFVWWFNVADSVAKNLLGRWIPREYQQIYSLKRSYLAYVVVDVSKVQGFRKDFPGIVGLSPGTRKRK